MYEEYLQLRRADWAKLGLVGCGTWTWLAFSLLLFSPFLLEASAVALALAVLIPLALVMGLVEHSLPSVWLLVVVFIQVCGLADLVSDFLLLGKVAIAQVTNDWSEVDVPEAESNDEIQLLLARLLITVIGALPTILYFAFVQNRIRAVLVDMGERTKDQKSSSTSNPGTSIVLMALVWKIAMVCLRLFVLFRVTKDIVSTGRIRKESKPWIAVVEFYLLADLLWSGIPLGVLTLLELFVYGEGFKGDQTQIFELIKLTAVSVDALAAAHLIYYGYLGLGGSWLHSHDDEHNEHTPINEPPTTIPSPPAVVPNTKVKAKAKASLPIDGKAEKERLVINGSKGLSYVVVRGENQV